MALAVLFAFGLNPNRDIHALPSPLIGKAAPVFTLTDVLDPSRSVSNAALQGTGLRAERVGVPGAPNAAWKHEELLAISQTHAVPMIGLVYMDQRDKAQQWLAQLGNPYQAVAFDTDGRTAIDWGVYGAAGDFPGRRTRPG